MFRARSTMMLALLSWLAGVGERFATMWRRLRSTFSRSRRDDPAANNIFVAPRKDHAGHSS
jgi:hypothetical protein